MIKYIEVAVLMQKNKGKLKPIGYVYRFLTAIEQRYV